MTPINSQMKLLYGSLAFFLGNLSILAPYIEVDTIYGRLRGTKAVARNGRTYYEFLGISYAKPPIGNLRFEPPEFPDSWNGIQEATFYGNSCLQYEFLTHFFTGDENCLTLNVYTHQVITNESLRKRASKKNLRPVIVYFHGGAFMSGFAYLYRPKYFMEEDIVLVTANYRLNSFGFLNTEDGVVRGNMGLKDQVMVLKWIQSNIENFGGDPDSVTLMGQSAGGVSAHYHQLSKLSKGLFHRGISMSGTVLQRWSLSKYPRRNADRLARSVGCYNENSLKMVQCLKSIHPYKIERFHKEYLNPLPSPDSFYLPSIERVDDENAFLTQDPEKLLREGKLITDSPWIFGVTNSEGLLGTGYFSKVPGKIQELEDSFSKYTSQSFDYEAHPNKDEISAKIYDFYFQNKSLSDPESTKALTQYYTDNLVNYNFHKALKLQLKCSKHPIYAYTYSYEGHTGGGITNIQIRMVGNKRIPRLIDFIIGANRKWTLHKLNEDKIEKFGVGHADELVTLFNIPIISEEIVVGSEDYPFSSEFVKLIYRFALTGKPGKIFDVEWEPSRFLDEKESKMSFIDLNLNPKIISEPFNNRIEFLNSLNFSSSYS